MRISYPDISSRSSCPCPLTPSPYCLDPPTQTHFGGPPSIHGAFRGVNGMQDNVKVRSVSYVEVTRSGRLFKKASLRALCGIAIAIYG